MANRCILLIEDQAEIRRMLRNGLESLEKGVRVIELPSGEEALLVLNRQPVDLAIIDIRLAGMTGLDFLNTARQRQPGLMAIVITGMTDEHTRQQLAVAGAQACF
jgi:CheY-like chemotaxis protein